MLVLIKGAGDLASGVALRLHHCGFKVIMTEIAEPTAVRTKVSFCEAVYDNTAQVEDVVAQLAQSPQEALKLTEAGKIAVLVDPEAKVREELPFDALIDGIMAKRNTGTNITQAPIVLALGPGFEAGVDCHGVVETKRGHKLGRLYTQGSAEPNTGVPGNIGGYTLERLLRAPAYGTFEPVAKIGDIVEEGQTVGHVDGQDMKAKINGVLRGLLHEGVTVVGNMKAGDVDPRCEIEDCFTVSDKALAIAGGALEGLLRFGQNVPKLREEGIWRG